MNNKKNKHWPIYLGVVAAFIPLIFSITTASLIQPEANSLKQSSFGLNDSSSVLDNGDNLNRKVDITIPREDIANRVRLNNSIGDSDNSIINVIEEGVQPEVSN